MRTRILALIIVAIMIFPTSFAAFAASEVEVTKVMFTDADMETELLSLYDYSEGVSCSFSYNSSEAATVYGMLLLKRNSMIVSSIEQEFSLETSGIAAFDDYLIPDMAEPGEYEAVFMLFDSKENMRLIDGSNAAITCSVYPDAYDATYGLGLDFELEASKSKMTYYRAAGNNDTASIFVTSEFAKNGNSSLAVPVQKAWDRVFTSSTLSTGAITNKLKGLGNGKYRVCGYIYPASEAVTFEPRLVVKNTGVNSGKEYNYASKFTAQPGKWTYFYADYNVEDYFSSTLTSARPQVQISATLKAEQYIYIDDLKLVKLEEGLEEMSAFADAIVKAQAEPDEVVIVTAEGTDGIYAIEAVTADENGVVQAGLSLSDDYDANDVTFNVYTKEKLSKKMSECLNTDDVTYADFRYFGFDDLNDVNVKSIIVDGVLMPYDEIILSEGDVSISFEIDNPLDKSLRIFAARYSNGQFKGSTVSIEGESDIVIEGVEAGDSVELFLVDENMTLSSHLYTLSQDGLTETEVTPAVADFDPVPKAFYNTVTSTVEFDINVPKDSFVILATYPADKAEDEDYAYIGVQKLTCGDNHVVLPIDKDRYEDSCLFNLDYYTTSADVSGSFEPYDYVGEKELKGYYETLNNPESATTEILNALSSKILNINFKYYNSLSQEPNAQKRILEFFMEYNKDKNITSAAQIQNIFDEAAATVVLSVSPSADAIEKLGDKIPLNEEYYADFNGETDEFKEETARLIKANSVDPEDSSKTKANELFEDAYITAQLTHNAETYGAFMKMVTETYNEEIGLNINDGASSDVFKYMFNNRSDIKNIDDVKELYSLAKNAVEDEEKETGKPSRGGGGGGGGGVGKYSAPVKAQEPVPAPARVKFKDMDDNHWALESVLFLNGIGVVSDAAAYRPDDFITREESVKMLVCSFGELDSAAQCDFADVDKTLWCYPYVASAYKSGMVNGISDTAFGTGENLSRQDALVMIYRIVKDKLEEVPEDYVFDFSDKNSINDYAADAVKALCSNGIVNGYSDGTFRPGVSISRAEFAKLLTTVFRR